MVEHGKVEGVLFQQLEQSGGYEAVVVRSLDKTGVITEPGVSRSACVDG